jgi:hypothetical protein
MRFEFLGSASESQACLWVLWVGLQVLLCVLQLGAKIAFLRAALLSLPPA